MAPRSRADAFLPLTPPMLHTLVALADGDKHGYAILKEIARRTDDTVRLSAGTLYALIRRAEADGLIVETDERPDISLDDERRRYYRLTPLGRKVAAAEIERLEAIVEIGAGEEACTASEVVVSAARRPSFAERIFRALVRAVPVRLQSRSRA